MQYPIKCSFLSNAVQYKTDDPTWFWCRCRTGWLEQNLIRSTLLGCRVPAPMEAIEKLLKAWVVVNVFDIQHSFNMVKVECRESIDNYNLHPLNYIECFQEQTRSRINTFKNEHVQEQTRSETNTFRNEHVQEWTRSRTNTFKNDHVHGQTIRELMGSETNMGSWLGNIWSKLEVFRERFSVAQSSRVYSLYQ